MQSEQACQLTQCISVLLGRFQAFESDCDAKRSYGYFTIRVANIIGNYLVKFSNTSGVLFTT